MVPQRAVHGKGIDSGVRTPWASRKDTRGTSTKQAAREDAFVGRELELEELSAGLDDARSGRGRVFLLSGEPGIGKSRLVDEFASRTRESGVRLLWGRCWEAGGAPPYWPWVQLLRAYLRGLDADAVRSEIGSGAVDIAQMLPEIREAFPNLPAPPTVDPDSARFQLFDSTTSFLIDAAGGGPMVLVLEDLHAADTPSLLLLRFLAEQIGDSKLLILGTYRDVELTPEHPLTSTVAELSRQPSTRIVHVQGLSEDDVARFVAAVTAAPLPPSLIAALRRETNGNPLFLGEAVRLLASEDRLGQLSDPATLRVVVPKGVRDVIVRRLGHLDEPCKRALSLASVLGTEFTTEALRRLGEMEAEDVLDALDRAADAGLIGPVHGALGRFRFSHELVRETLYEESTSANRMRLHRHAAEVLREMYATNEQAHLAELAHHFFEAAPLGDAAIATDYARRAGDEAGRSLAYEDAAGLYRMAVQALELEEPIDEETLAELLLAWGDAQARSGDLPGARETFLRAARLAGRTGAAHQLARAALGYGGRLMWARAGNDPHLVPLLQDALVLLGGSDDHLRVRLLGRLACALRSSPDRERSDTLSRQAVDMARALGDPSTLGYALVARLWAIYWPDNPEQRFDIAQEILRVGEAANDAERIFDGHSARAMAFNDLGAVADARAEQTAMAKLAEGLRQPAQGWPVRAFRTFMALLAGDLEGAQDLITSELHPGQPATAIRDEESSHQMHLFLLRREQGRLAEVEESAHATIAEFPWYPSHRAALACLLLDLGREKEARAVFDDLAADRFRALYRDCEWLLGMALASEACSRLGDRNAAAVAFELLLPFAGAHAIAHAEGSVGAVDRYLGLLAATLGRLDEAIAHLGAAIVVNERMGARPWVAHTQHDEARVLLQRDQPGDRERAAELLGAARRTAELIGMTALGARIDALFSATGSASAPSTTASPSGSSVVRREGEYWTVVFDGDAFRLKDAKGLRYLAKLLAEPGREFHVLDLAAGGAVPAAATAGAGRSAVRGDALGDAGPALDPQAKEAYRRRLEDLEDEIGDAEAIGDADRAERARGEREFIAHELASAIGLGGRDRPTGSASERARVNVTRAIKAAMERIEEHCAPLAKHLQATLRTGTYCSYTPDPRLPVTWQL